MKTIVLFLLTMLHPGDGGPSTIQAEEMRLTANYTVEASIICHKLGKQWLSAKGKMDPKKSYSFVCLDSYEAGVLRYRLLHQDGKVAQ